MYTVHLLAHRGQHLCVLRFTNLSVLGGHFSYGHASGGPAVSIVFSLFLTLPGSMFLFKMHRRASRVSLELVCKIITSGNSETHGEEVAVTHGA